MTRTFRIPLFGYWRLYIANHPMKNKTFQDEGIRLQKHRKDRMKSQLYTEQDCKCAECGKTYGYHEMELHHIIPRSLAPELRGSKANCMVVCKACHRAIHNNPYRMVELIDNFKNKE